ncbi:hypothetical protein KX928_00735 [Roseobacter sp. YSTF-M11]|uniref:Uncharacterized protein n=1 Tax=Roseobacter insulae TaxID=2859783 RepID=A0A9X1JWL9_9RHOB|nr:DUF5765 domain-containing protein [Roseobacter insulae]MBW4706305.1 hypothetical protein [Roseobacter insulae]
MCWSIEASAAMVIVGAVATGVTLHHKQPAAIWATLGYFTAMEALQVAGYIVVDKCGTPANQTITLLSYLHIVFQPIFINLFAMELVPGAVRRRVRVWILSLCAGSSAVMLAQIIPWETFGTCQPGTALCGQAYCTVSGEWHIAWDVPYNGLLRPLEAALGTHFGFPTYMAAAFALPLLYGAWRFVLLHLVTGPVLAWYLTDDPNEMPAIWCLFSIAILCISLSPPVRRSVTSRSWWGVAV